MTTRTIYIVPARPNASHQPSTRSYTNSVCSSSSTPSTSIRQITINRHIPTLTVQSSASNRAILPSTAAILQPITSNNKSLPSTTSNQKLSVKRPFSRIAKTESDYYDIHDDDDNRRASTASPLPTLSAATSIDDLLGLSANDAHPVRKRERLTHLTAEEKLNRRKIKNRVAAQTARDRKKVRTCKLEEALHQLVNENKLLRDENKRITSLCDDLKERNTQLEMLVNDYKTMMDHRVNASTNNTINNNNNTDDNQDETIKEEITKSNHCSAQSSLGSAEGTGVGVEQAATGDDGNSLINGIDLEEIINELFEDDPELEQFCSQMLVDERQESSSKAEDESNQREDTRTTASSSTAAFHNSALVKTASTSQNSQTSRVDSPTSHIYLAPEYLHPTTDNHLSPNHNDQSPASPLPSSASLSPLHVVPRSPNSNISTTNTTLPSPSTSTIPICDEPLDMSLTTNDIHNNSAAWNMNYDLLQVDDESKFDDDYDKEFPFIGNDDPILGAQLVWDDFTMGDDEFELASDAI